MLSRIAESLFWIGRYVERTDDTARLLQTHLRMLSEDNAQAESDACRNLLALMSVDHIEQPHADDLLRVLCFDRSESTSIFAGWGAARDNARRAREVIPLELWECINTTWQRLPDGHFNTARTYPFLDWVRQRSGLFAGIARGTMVRDDGWQFLLLGRSPGAGRHDVAHGLLGRPDHRQHQLAVGAARHGRLRRVPPYPPRAAHRPRRRTLPHRRRPVSAVDHARPGLRLGVPGEAGPGESDRGRTGHRGQSGRSAASGPGSSTPRSKTCWRRWARR